MTKEMLIPLLRHFLTGLGAVLVTKGILSAGQSDEVVGALTTLFSVGWYVIESRKKKKATATVTTTAGVVGLVGLLTLFTGCTTFSNHVFRTEQTAVSVAYNAYEGWTNYMAHFQVSPQASNDVKQARLKFAATVKTVEALRYSYATNSAMKPTLQATLATLSGQSSNVVWLINFYSGK